MAKTVRSPNYPVISLREAVERIGAVWEQENKHPTEKQAIAQALGYGTLNGASMGVISALTKFGFLEPVAGGQLKVGPLGTDVAIYGHREPEFIGAVRAAAFRPTLFSELFDRYGPTLPSDNSLRAHLIKKGFNPRTVDGVIRSYRDTIQFLDEETGGLWLEDGQGSLLPVGATTHASSVTEAAGADRSEGFLATMFGRPSESTSSSAQAATTGSVVPQEGVGQVLAFKIAEDAEARVEFRGRVTQEAIVKLIKLLELQQDTFPKKDAHLLPPRNGAEVNEPVA